MCPKFEADFENSTINTPIYEKGTYELVVKGVNGAAFPQDEPKKNPSQVKVGGSVLSVGAQLRFEMVGEVDSRGNVNKLDPQVDNVRVSNQTLWLHNKPSRDMSKGIVMAILGWPRDEEEEFNEWYKTQDFSFEVDEREDGEGFECTLGPAWEQLKDHHVYVNLDRGTYENKKQGTTEEQQKFSSWKPVVAVEA